MKKRFIIITAILCHCIQLDAEFLQSYQVEKTKETKANIGILSIDKTVDNSWAYLAPLMELFLDDNIKAIVLLFEIDYGYFGTPMAFSLAKSITQLKKIYKKPVIAYGENWLSSSAYIIAASADHIMTAPLCLLGHISYRENYTDYSIANSNNGSHETPVKGGLYKYFRDSNHSISKEDVKKLQDYFEECWQYLIKELVFLKPKLDQHKKHWIDGDVFLANNGSKHIENFFIDSLGDKLDLEKYVANLIKEEQKKSLIKSHCQELVKIELNSQKKEKIVILNATKSLRWQDSNYYCTILNQVFLDENVKGIVINVACNGANSCAVLYNLFTQITKLKQKYKKTVVAYIDSTAFSGGYWLACFAEYIIASPLSEIGSIGNRWGRRDYTKHNTLKHVIVHAISANKYGNIFNEHKELQDAELLQIQEIVDGGHLAFINQVKSARPKLISNESVWKEAQIYTAHKACEIGLVDSIGCPIDAIKYIEKEKALSELKIVFYNFFTNEKEKN